MRNLTEQDEERVYSTPFVDWVVDQEDRAGYEYCVTDGVDQTYEWDEESEKLQPNPFHPAHWKNNPQNFNEFGVSWTKIEEYQLPLDWNPYDQHPSDDDSLEEPSSGEDPPDHNPLDDHDDIF